MNNKNIFNDYLLKITSRVKQYERKVLNDNDIDLTTREFDYLAIFVSNKDTKLTGMADQLGVSKSTLSNTIKKMVSKGYISVRRDESDDRVKVVTLTEKGEKGHRIRNEVRAKYYNLINDSISTDEKSKFFQIMNKIINAIDEDNKK